jgi:thiol:disulfide interchange protein
MRILFFLLALGSAALAEKKESTVTFLPEVSSVAPGKPFTMALKLEHPEKWHSYYINSGGVELPPEIKWNLPEGASAGPIQWPTPEVKEGFGGKSFVYNGSPVFLIEITPPSTLTPGSTFTFSARANWQICEKSCIDEEASFTLNLPIAESPIIDPTQTSLFETARQRIPKKLPDDVKAAAYPAKTNPDFVELELKGLDARPTDFIPNQAYLKALSDGGEVTESDGGYLLKIARKKVDFLDEPIPQGNSLSGILVGAPDLIVPELEIGGSADSDKKAAVYTFADFIALLPILGGMFLGGLILNLMPCVFPVIGLKIMGFVQQAGSDRKKIVMHGVVFTLGVLASFAVLSGILFAARGAAGGDSIGWGYQLQNPWVVVSLMLLMFLLALNMFGLFEIGASATSVGGSLQTKQGLSGSFFSGILATVVATPCSAPFLGAAIGAAIALPAIPFFTAFAAMAIGLSTPYLVLSIFPKLIDLLPRPGAWMESFKQGMSFLLFATAGYLLWVYAGQIDLDNLLNPIFGLSAIAAAAWIYGRWNLPHLAKRSRVIGVTLALTLAIAGLFLVKPPKPSSLEWQVWSPEKVEEIIKEGKPVYIDFTAKWCVTCQANKKFAYTEEVIALANKKQVVFLKADKTKPNPTIETKLRELNRTAIPVNVLMIPGQEPVITPEILTPQILTDLFKKIPDHAKEE